MYVFFIVAVDIDDYTYEVQYTIKFAAEGSFSRTIEKVFIKKGLELMCAVYSAKFMHLLDVNIMHVINLHINKDIMKNKQQFPIWQK
jgi:hypothetical protein